MAAKFGCCGISEIFLLLILFVRFKKNYFTCCEDNLKVTFFKVKTSDLKFQNGAHSPSRS